jgi:hypothetical protein
MIHPTVNILHRAPGEYVPSWMTPERNATPPMLHGSNILSPERSRYAYGLTVNRRNVPSGHAHNEGAPICL